MGLFGLSNQDLFLVLSSAHTVALLRELQARLPKHVQVIDSLLMLPTVRPKDHAPLHRPGVYVFRFFETTAGAVDEIAALSDQAWQFFEKSREYKSEPMGLFRFADLQASHGRMLLLTWYDDLNSWERSRNPDPKTTENFNRRRALTQSATPYATRLANTEPR